MNCFESSNGSRKAGLLYCSRLVCYDDPDELAEVSERINPLELVQQAPFV